MLGDRITSVGDHGGGNNDVGEGNTVPIDGVAPLCCGATTNLSFFNGGEDGVDSPTSPAIAAAAAAAAAAYLYFIF